MSELDVAGKGPSIPELDDISLVKKDTSHRVLFVFKALMYGIEVQIGDLAIRLAETDTNGVCPIVVYTGQNTFVGMPDLTIQWLSEHAAAMPDDEYEQLTHKLAVAKTLDAFHSR